MVTVTFFIAKSSSKQRYTNFVLHYFRVTRTSCQFVSEESVLLEAHFRRAGVRLQPFAIGQLRRDRPKYVGARFAYLDDAAALLEIVDAQWRREARRAGRRQHVVRARAVVAQAL